jgi:hypothetical protein
MFQVSAQIDQFAKMGKPIHVTGVQVPSDTALTPELHDREGVRLDGGCWHHPWSEEVQAEWLGRFVEIALSKPFVDSVCWQDLTDHPRQQVLHGGLLRHDFSPKQSYQRWVKARMQVLDGGRRTEVAYGA